MSLPTSEEIRAEREWKRRGKPHCARCHDGVEVNADGLCRRCVDEVAGEAEAMHDEIERDMHIADLRMEEARNACHELFTEEAA